MMTDKASPTATRANPAPRKRRSGWWRKALIYAFVAVLLALIIAGMRPGPIPVETARVTRAPLTVSVMEEGRTRIRHRHVVSAPIAGHLNRVELRAGDRVERGRTILAAIEAERAHLLDARTRAETEARRRAAQALADQRRAELERARAAHALAQREFDRIDALHREGTTSREEWDAAETRLLVLARELDSIGHALRAAEYDVEQLDATLSPPPPAAQATTITHHITAPVDGVVLNVFEESARVVAAGTPIMEVGDTGDLEVEVELLSSDAARVERGAEVSLLRWGGDQPLRGRVSLVEPGAFMKVSALGVEEQRVKVRVDLLDDVPPGYQLGDRYRVEARIVTWHGDDVLQVPTGALFRRGNEWMAFIIEEGAARLRTVEIGQSSGTEARVLDGLSEGDIVVVYPPDGLDDGSAVK